MYRRYRCLFCGMRFVSIEKYHHAINRAEKPEYQSKDPKPELTYRK